MPKSLSVKNIPNLCRKLAHRYMQAFYTDWVYKVFWHFLKMYPICVECLHIGICKHSTQIGYIRLTPIPFLHKLGTFSKMCPICVECLRIKKYIYNYNFIIVNGIISVRLQFDMINLEKQRAQTKQKGLVKFES